MKILFLVPYPLKESPSQRFRFEQYFNILHQRGITYEVQSFLTNKNWQLFFKPGNVHLKALALISGFMKRIAILFILFKYDFVFIHREATPVGPPVFEWLIARLFRRKIIYDFDDAIWLTDRKNESRLLRVLKWRSKVSSICRWSYKVSCGNNYLCNYALQFNPNVIYNPTTIDTVNLHNPSLYKKHPTEAITIGWTGSHSTLKYLKEIERMLKILEDEFPQIRTVVIADRPPDLSLNSLVFKKWNINTEIEDLYQFDIGIMPLPDDEWSNGKCGFKALQYMAMEIPTIASPVGVNTRIINHKIDGFLASSANEWKTYLELLIKDRALRLRIGKEGRQKVISSYSVPSNTNNFLSLFA
ncbi:glycosyltransferase family 4 protein [Chryseosolibacter indicus]|uniref:Glycosyltransferase family 4 protein n=1 Tax=Chryseosolibacter indicus TaxID=2782351 RepID=A0ABS5VKP8_9BACT|nr:glycosyltransferase family 4 protein [Chryseosolibacter indicus]MBT1702025.1 glycosyltransferase family 4 protein [Chryseosolibacter indicus]